MTKLKLDGLKGNLNPIPVMSADAFKAFLLDVFKYAGDRKMHASVYLPSMEGRNRNASDWLSLGNVYARIAGYCFDSNPNRHTNDNDFAFDNARSDEDLTARLAQCEMSRNLAIRKIVYHVPEFQHPGDEDKAVKADLEKMLYLRCALVHKGLFGRGDFQL